MQSYMVLFDPLTHADTGYQPPDGVDGGIMGDTENGLMAVYRVPDELEASFRVSLAGCATVLRSERLGEK